MFSHRNLPYVVICEMSLISWLENKKKTFADLCIVLNLAQDYRRNLDIWYMMKNKDICMLCYVFGILWSLTNRWVFSIVIVNW